MKIQDFFKTLSYEEVAFFGKAQKNRKINEKHVNDFVNFLKDKVFVPDEDGDMLAYGLIPIIVNPVTNHVLDGQHKLAAYKKAIDSGLIPSDVKILVGYWKINDETHENEVTVMLNTKSKNWSLADFLNAYAQDNKCYSGLVDFCEKHDLCKKITKDGVQLKFRYGAAIITGSACEKSLKNGTFSYTEDQFAVADIVHNEMVSIRKKLGLKNASNEIEYMAKVWHEKRKEMTANDIVSLTYIPCSVRNMQITTQKDWVMVFLLLNEQIKKDKSKSNAA